MKTYMFNTSFILLLVMNMNLCINLDRDLSLSNSSGLLNIPDNLDNLNLLISKEHKNQKKVVNQDIGNDTKSYINNSSDNITISQNYTHYLNNTINNSSDLNNTIVIKNEIIDNLHLFTSRLNSNTSTYININETEGNRTQNVNYNLTASNIESSKLPSSTITMTAKQKEEVNENFSLDYTKKIIKIKNAYSDDGDGLDPNNPLIEIDYWRTKDLSIENSKAEWVGEFETKSLINFIELEFTFPPEILHVSISFDGVIWYPRATYSFKEKIIDAVKKMNLNKSKTLITNVSIPIESTITIGFIKLIFKYSDTLLVLTPPVQTLFTRIKIFSESQQSSFLIRLLSFKDGKIVNYCLKYLDEPEEYSGALVLEECYYCLIYSINKCMFNYDSTILDKINGHASPNNILMYYYKEKILNSTDTLNSNNKNTLDEDSNNEMKTKVISQLSAFIINSAGLPNEILDQSNERKENINIVNYNVTNSTNSTDSININNTKSNDINNKEYVKLNKIPILTSIINPELDYSTDLFSIFTNSTLSYSSNSTDSISVGDFTINNIFARDFSYYSSKVSIKPNCENIQIIVNLKKQVIIEEIVLAWISVNFDYVVLTFCEFSYCLDNESQFTKMSSSNNFNYKQIYNYSRTASQSIKPIEFHTIKNLRTSLYSLFKKTKTLVFDFFFKNSDLSNAICSVQIRSLSIIQSTIRLKMQKSNSFEDANLDIEPINTESREETAFKLNDFNNPLAYYQNKFLLTKINPKEFETEKILDVNIKREKIRSMLSELEENYTNINKKYLNSNSPFLKEVVQFENRFNELLEDLSQTSKDINKSELLLDGFEKSLGIKLNSKKANKRSANTNDNKHDKVISQIKKRKSKNNNTTNIASLSFLKQKILNCEYKECGSINNINSCYAPESNTLKILIDIRNMIVSSLTSYYKLKSDKIQNDSQNNLVNEIFQIKKLFDKYLKEYSHFFNNMFNDYHETEIGHDIKNLKYFYKEHKVSDIVDKLKENILFKINAFNTLNHVNYDSLQESATDIKQKISDIGEQLRLKEEKYYNEINNLLQNNKLIVPLIQKVYLTLEVVEDESKENNIKYIKSFENTVDSGNKEKQEHEDLSSLNKRISSEEGSTSSLFISDSINRAFFQLSGDSSLVDEETSNDLNQSIMNKEKSNFNGNKDNSFYFKKCVLTNLITNAKYDNLYTKFVIVYQKHNLFTENIFYIKIFDFNFFVFLHITFFKIQLVKRYLDKTEVLDTYLIEDKYDQNSEFENFQKVLYFIIQIKNGQYSINLKVDYSEINSELSTLLTEINHYYNTNQEETNNNEDNAGNNRTTKKINYYIKMFGYDDNYLKELFNPCFEIFKGYDLDLVMSGFLGFYSEPSNLKMFLTARSHETTQSIIENVIKKNNEYTNKANLSIKSNIENKFYSSLGEFNSEYMTTKENSPSLQQSKTDSSSSISNTVDSADISNNSIKIILNNVFSYITTNWKLLTIPFKTIFNLYLKFNVDLDLLSTNIYQLLLVDEKISKRLVVIEFHKLKYNLLVKISELNLITTTQTKIIRLKINYNGEKKFKIVIEKYQDIFKYQIKSKKENKIGLITLNNFNFISVLYTINEYNINSISNIYVSNTDNLRGVNEKNKREYYEKINTILKEESQEKNTDKDPDSDDILL